ncbi:MAG: polysaccharide biosynthesis C-terminal domain-containing protein [Vicinamibacterales bacterium]
MGLLTAAGRLVPASFKQRSLRRNVVLNWAAAFLAAAVALGTTPLVVHALDTENYGVWTFLNGLTLYSNLLYVGLGAAFMTRLSDAVGRGDVAVQTRLLGVALTLYAALGTVCFLAAELLSPVVPHLFATPLTPEAQSAATLTLGLLGVRLLFMFLNSAFSALLASHGRWDLVSGIIVVATLARTVGVVWATYQPTPIVKLAAVVVLDAALQLPLLMAACRAVAPSVAIRPVMPERQELRGLYGFGVQAFVLQVAVLVIAYTDTALIGVLLGASAVTLYALPLQLIEHSRVVINGITQSLLPELAAFRARGDVASLKALYLDASRACGALSAFVNVHLVMLGPAFLRLWVGPEIATGSFNILLFLAIGATASALSTQILTPFYQAFDRQRYLVGVVVAEAVVNFGLSVWLSRALGVWGVALATAVPAAGITLALAPRFILPRIGVGLRDFARRVALPSAALGAACALTQALLAPWVDPTSYARLALRVAVAGAVALPVIVVVFPRETWMPLAGRVAPSLARRLDRLGARPN